MATDLGQGSRVERFVRMVHQDPALAGVGFDFLKVEAEAASDWPRVAWVPRKGRVERVQLATCGGLLIGDEAVSGQARRASLGFMDTAEVEVRCWHRDLEAAELLFDAVRNSCWRLAKAAVTFGEYSVSSQQPGAADDAASGVVVKFTASVKLVAPTALDTTTTITTHKHTGEFQSDLDPAKLEQVC